jgi:hypothetical protein
MAQLTPHSSLVWRKATSSEAGSCVEVAHSEKAVFVRDSKNPEGTVLQITRSRWSEFLQTIQDGKYDGTVM